MSPGTWTNLAASGQNAALGVGPVSGSMIHYCNQMPWNKFNASIEIVGMDHAAGMQRHVRFNTATNNFDVIQADTGAGAATRHGYGHSTVNPFTGDLYHRLAEYDYEGANIGFLVRKKALGAATFSDMPRVARLFYMQNAIGSCWWSGSFAGAGAQGCLLLFNSGDSYPTGSATDGGIYAYNPLANSWFWRSQSMAPWYGNTGASYSSVMAYSARKNVAVYGGGHERPTKLWRLNADRSFTPMPDCPTDCQIGVQRGVLCEDPVSGNFLVLSQRNIFELNPDGAGSWTKLTGSRVPPAAVGDPAVPHGVICTPIAEHNVIAYITQTAVNGGTFFLYKHA